MPLADYAEKNMLAHIKAHWWKKSGKIVFPVSKVELGLSDNETEQLALDIEEEYGQREEPALIANEVKFAIIGWRRRPVGYFKDGDPSSLQLIGYVRFPLEDGTFSSPSPVLYVLSLTGPLNDEVLRELNAKSTELRNLPRIVNIGHIWATIKRGQKKTLGKGDSSTRVYAMKVEFPSKEEIVAELKAQNSEMNDVYVGDELAAKVKGIQESEDFQRWRDAYRKKRAAEEDWRSFVVVMKEGNKTLGELEEEGMLEDIVSYILEHADKYDEKSVNAARQAMDYLNAKKEQTEE